MDIDVNKYSNKVGCRYILNFKISIIFHCIKMKKLYLINFNYKWALLKVRLPDHSEAQISMGNVYLCILLQSISNA